MKFKVGDIITNGKVIFRIEGIGNNCLGHFYNLVDVETEKKGNRYLKMAQDKPQANIIQNITINLHNTTEKVYTLTSVWNNGEHFEGEISTKVYANKDLATSVLVAKAHEAKQNLLIRYDEEDINVEMRDGYIMVEADEYADYWEGTVEEQTVIGKR